MECLGSKKMNSIGCDVCPKWYHAECADLEFTFESYVKFDLPFFCSIKCSMKLIPFTQLKNPSEIEELNYNKDSFPCKVCYEQCLGYDLEDCIQCDFCLEWLHYECSDTPYNDIKNIAETDKPFSCNFLRCDMRNFPYHSSNIETLLADNFNSLTLKDLNPRQSNLPPLINSSLATSSRGFFKYSLSNLKNCLL